jgi:drug/metabolite transporter (DMT)-like permease
MCDAFSMQSEETAPKSTSWLPGFILLGIVWGASFLFIKWGLLTLSPVGVAFGRCLIGALTLLIYVTVTKAALPRKISEWFHIAVVAFFLNALPSYLFAIGETHVSSVMAGLLNATTPLMTVLVISFGYREQKVDRNQMLGVLIGFLGIALVTGAFSGLHGNDIKGFAALLGATFCYGVSMPYSKKHVSGLPYSASALAATQVTSAAIMLLPFTIVSHPITHSWNTKSVLGMLILGAIGTGFAYIWNFRNIRLAGSAIASTVTYITPVVATILGILFLNEKARFTQLLGAALVLLSAALVQKRIAIFKK